jgi:hypothetical protein
MTRKIDVSIPIGAVMALTGVTTYPKNFAVLDGSVVNEPRSPFNGKTLPNWGQTEGAPYCSNSISSSGTVSTVNDKTYSIIVEDKHLPKITIDPRSEGTIKTTSVIEDIHSLNTRLSNANAFNTNVTRIDQYPSGYDTADANEGGNNYKIFDYSTSYSVSSYNAGHNHNDTNISVTHPEHSITSNSSTADGYIYPSQQTLSYNAGVSNNISQSFPTKVKGVTCMWIMRIY